MCSLTFSYIVLSDYSHIPPSAIPSHPEHPLPTPSYMSLPHIQVFLLCLYSTAFNQGRLCNYGFGAIPWNQVGSYLICTEDNVCLPESINIQQFVREVFKICNPGRLRASGRYVNWKDKTEICQLLVGFRFAPKRSTKALKSAFALSWTGSWFGRDFCLLLQSLCKALINQTLTCFSGFLPRAQQLFVLPERGQINL